MDIKTRKDAQDALQAIGDPGAAKSAKYYAGDHWQGGAEWAGPMPRGAKEHAEITQAMLLDIKRGFISRNVIREVTDRQINAIAARGIPWKIASASDKDAAPQELIDEAGAALRQWVKNRKATGIVRKAAASMSYAGAGALRLFIPAGRYPLSEDGYRQIPTAAELEEAASMIHIENPAHAKTTPAGDMAAIVIDESTRDEIAIFRYQKKKETYAEIVYIEDGQTVIKIVGPEDSDDDDGQIIRFDLGGRLTMYQMERDALITEQVRSQQRALNMALSMMARNNVVGGFLERVILNALAPGRFEEDANGQKVFIAEPYITGGGSLNILQGIRHGENDEQITTPDIKRFEPVSVDTFIDSEEAHYRAILGETHQLHYATAGATNISADSRITAMADYIIDLYLVKVEIDLAWAWLLETVLKWSAEFSGKAGRYDGLRVEANATINPGPIPPEMIRAVTEAVRSRLLSEETGRQWVGVEDVENEARLIEEQIEREAATPIPGLAEIERIIGQGRQNGPTA